MRGFSSEDPEVFAAETSTATGLAIPPDSISNNVTAMKMSATRMHEWYTYQWNKGMMLVLNWLAQICETPVHKTGAGDRATRSAHGAGVVGGRPIVGVRVWCVSRLGG